MSCIDENSSSKLKSQVVEKSSWINVCLANDISASYAIIISIIHRGDKCLWDPSEIDATHHFETESIEKHFFFETIIQKKNSD